MLEDIKAIAELEPSGIFHIAVLFSLVQICINSFVRRCSLTRTSVSCTQNAYFPGHSKSIQIYFSVKRAKCFSFFYTNFNIFQQRSLTRTSTSLYKTPITGQFQNQYKSFLQNFNLFLFLFLFCFARTSNDLFFIYAFEK